MIRTAACVVGGAACVGGVWFAAVGSRHRPMTDAVTPLAAVESALDTGDLVLFDRRCLDFSWYGAVLCQGAKVVSPWDHVGMVVRDGSGALSIIEADVKGVTLRDLDARVTRSRRSNAIAVRPLLAVRTPEMRRKADEFVKEVRNHPYNKDMLQLFRAWVDTETKRTHLEALRDVCEAHDRLHDLQASGAPQDQVDAAAATVAELESATSRPDSWTKGAIFHNQADHSSFFCSELVATAYQRIGLLPTPTPPSNEYLPATFAPDAPAPLPLLRGAKFGPVVRVK